uniref:ATP synthase F0 subunit 8 n=1 Tax=Leptynoptera sulfurea TaxID=1950150 RepID=A0A344A2I2_9HEMI|nr:ATP synthase F0 subunit 8 [Leptynoptera sulfurea]AWU48973.1 ATP synthase F0 subunit 8 [Leptynoptera sulfurea]
MPQMAPMSWILLLIMTFSVLMYISSYLYFSMWKKNMKPKNMNNFFFTLKW